MSMDVCVGGSICVVGGVNVLSCKSDRCQLALECVALIRSNAEGAFFPAIVMRSRFYGF